MTPFNNNNNNNNIVICKAHKVSSNAESEVNFLAIPICWTHAQHRREVIHKTSVCLQFVQCTNSLTLFAQLLIVDFVGSDSD